MTQNKKAKKEAIQKHLPDPEELACDHEMEFQSIKITLFAGLITTPVFSNVTT